MFSCGSEAMDWIANNCERCTKYNQDPDKSCKFSNKLHMGFFGGAPTLEEGSAYNCRHTFASHALTAGVTPGFIAKQMGDRMETVLRNYAKWIEGDADQREMKKLNGDFAGNGISKSR